MSIYQQLVASGRVIDVHGKLSFDRLIEECYLMRRNRECATAPDGKPVRIDCIDLIVSERMYHYGRAVIHRMFANRYGYEAVDAKYEEVAANPTTMFGLRMVFSKFHVNELGCSIALVFLGGSPVTDTDIAVIDFSDIPLFSDTFIHPERHVIFKNVLSISIP